MSLELRELDRNILKIPIADASFDTHSTHGEHALKEYGSWTRFAHAMEDAGATFVAEDPFAHYVQEGPGRFYRAYPERRDTTELVAAMTITPIQRRDYRVDHVYSSDDSSEVAAACRTMLRRNFFGEFTGIIPYMPPATHLRIATKDLCSAPGLARAVYDWGLKLGDDVVIPMPGIAPMAQENMKEEFKEKARTTIAEHETTAVLAYSKSETDDVYVLTEEYYRTGVHVGALAVRSELDRSLGPRKDSYAAVDYAGNEVDVAALSADDQEDRVEVTERQARFLRALALHDRKLGILILG